MPNKPKYKLPSEERLKRSAVHYLERYASSSANLRRVLERKVLKACQSHERDPADFADMIDAVVEKCVGTGLVNDQAYAETKTASLRRRGGSKRKIEAQLAAKGVDRQTIEDVVQDDPEAELEAAFRFARRRRLGPYRSRTGTSRDPQLQRDKDLAAMCRAGFSFDHARQVIDTEINQDLDDFK